MGAEAQGLGEFSAAFPGHQQEARKEVEQQRLKLASKWDDDATGRSLACFATAQPQIINISICPKLIFKSKPNCWKP